MFLCILRLPTTPKKKKKRGEKTQFLEIEDTNGAMSILAPQKSIWYSFYVQNIQVFGKCEAYILYMANLFEIWYIIFIRTLNVWSITVICTEKLSSIRQE